MSEWKAICRIDDIPVLGARRVARPVGVAVAVFRNSEDQVFALLDRCPHKGGPLSQGIVFGTSVACPLHNWAIGLDDGCAKSPDEGCTPKFAVKVTEGVVHLDAEELKTHAIDLAPPRAGPGAATAGKLGDETFDVQAPHGS
ncbi:nitrite reductase (NADH) small subunit [Variovorax paradoxus]|jgi:nitrite reductase (NADH) small subunit|uniref:nitrite reductase small subunit NirD n=1 Tax=Variovorax paradoxus TaxID=34073 RepID=UPI0027900F9B|nr:nitrite reductase small subunit NirD [Variovorax paradoxus]MDQ0569291.1 nitrite reductase (NADH) small subunit [Variovorax paradoxus]